jgi:hypothetical protein
VIFTFRDIPSYRWLQRQDSIQRQEQGGVHPGISPTPVPGAADRVRVLMCRAWVGGMCACDSLGCWWVLPVGAMAVKIYNLYDV